MFRRSFLTLLLVAPAGIAYAGAISVDVVDAVTTRPLAGVTVTAESRTGESRNVTTGSDGSAYFEDLADGFYEFRAEADGYVPGVEPAVRIIDRRTEQLRFELRPQAAAVEQVVVVGRARGADPYGSAADRYLTRDELSEGSAGLAAPVFDRDGHVVAALVVGGPSVRLAPNLARFGKLTKDTARAISRVLGATDEAIAEAR